jgi:hypothetical protein
LDQLFKQFVPFIYAKKAFHDARKIGEKLLSEGQIAWDDYRDAMVHHEEN